MPQGASLGNSRDRRRRVTTWWSSTDSHASISPSLVASPTVIASPSRSTCMMAVTTVSVADTSPSLPDKVSGRTGGLMRVSTTPRMTTGWVPSVSFSALSSRSR